MFANIHSSIIFFQIDQNSGWTVHVQQLMHFYIKYKKFIKTKKKEIKLLSGEVQLLLQKLVPFEKEVYVTQICFLCTKILKLTL